MQKIKHLAAYVYRRPIWFTFISSILSGFAIVMVTSLKFSFTSHSFRLDLHLLFAIPIAGILIGLFLIAPFVFTIYNLIYLSDPRRKPEIRNAGKAAETYTIVLGALYSLLYAFLKEQIRWGMDWTEQLYNSELHTPIATWTLPTILVIAGVAIAGYCILRCKNINRLPPLLAVLSMAGMYLGAVLCVLWIIQISKHDFLLCLYPFNLVLLAVKTVKEVIGDYQLANRPIPQKRILQPLHRLLKNTKCWPWLGILFALPLLGTLIAVLILFGQAPDSIIQAWTQTSDWTFSQQVAPQNLYQDMHYLCTVSAGGHKKLVKPLRVGQRHGHRVLVNRQLCIANAFEQLLAERLPRFHWVVRRFYDRFGYPIAKHIRSPYTADVVFLIMKPLEWFFLFVLYLCDPTPENRIAVQYPHSPPPKAPI